jgi:ketosteroid isomerase-like protein
MITTPTIPPSFRFGTLALLISLLPAPAFGQTAAEVQALRADLEVLYQCNSDAYQRYDLAGILALRAPDFHAIMPDGSIRDRAAMETYIGGFLNGVKQWRSMTLTIDSLQVTGDTALAIVAQHVDRMALRPDNAVHHVETWVTQRETWIRTGGQWLMWRVDQLRNQRRLVDGKPE